MSLNSIATLAACLSFGATSSSADLYADVTNALVRVYERDMATESGRVKWHGRRVRTDEDMTNLVQTVTYEDGYTFSQPFRRSAPLTVEQRFALERRRREKEEKSRLAQLPPGLQAVQSQRQANASTTNEVTVHFGQTGAEGRPAVYNRP